MINLERSASLIEELLGRHLGLGEHGAEFKRLWERGESFILLASPHLSAPFRFRAWAEAHDGEFLALTAYDLEAGHALLEPGRRAFYWIVENDDASFSLDLLGPSFAKFQDAGIGMIKIPEGVDPPSLSWIQAP